MRYRKVRQTSPLQISPVRNLFWVYGGEGEDFILEHQKAWKIVSMEKFCLFKLSLSYRSFNFTTSNLDGFKSDVVRMEILIKDRIFIIITITTTVTITLNISCKVDLSGKGGRYIGRAADFYDMWNKFRQLSIHLVYIENWREVWREVLTTHRVLQSHRSNKSVI